MTATVNSFAGIFSGPRNRRTLKVSSFFFFYLHPRSSNVIIFFDTTSYISDLCTRSGSPIAALYLMRALSRSRIRDWRGSKIGKCPPNVRGEVRPSCRPRKRFSARWPQLFPGINGSADRRQNSPFRSWPTLKGIWTNCSFTTRVKLVEFFY